jgi:hypothetical protein
MMFPCSCVVYSCNFFPFRYLVYCAKARSCISIRAGNAMLYFRYQSRTDLGDRVPGANDDPTVQDVQIVQKDKRKPSRLKALLRLTLASSR